MNLLEDLQDEHNLTYLLIAHHLATVRYMCDTVGVMYLAGSSKRPRRKNCTTTRCIRIHGRLCQRHCPRIRILNVRRSSLSEGALASEPPEGCHFHPRCPSGFEPCAETPPVQTEPVPGHRVVCHLY